MGAVLWDLYENQKAKGLTAAMRQTLSKLEKSGQADDRWFNAMGELALSSGNHAVAARFFRHAMDEKDRPEYTLNLANAQFYAGDFAAAGKILETHMRKHPHDVHGLIVLANCHLRLGEMSRVRELCNSALAHKVAKAPLWNCLGHASFLEGNFGKAWTLFDKAYAEEPAYADALFNRGNAAYRLGKVEQAAKDFALCIRKDENHEGALLNLAIAKLELGEIPSGKEYVSRALKLNPALTDGHHVVGRLCMAAKEFRSARDAFREALKIDAYHTASLIALAGLHIQEAEQEEARILLRRLLAQSGLQEEELLATLTLLLEIGEHAQCVEYLSHAEGRELAPGPRKILILALWRTARTKEAIRHLETLLASQGESSDSLTLLGRMLAQSGAGDLAEVRYRKALELDPAFQEAAFELARILLSKGEGEKAVSILKSLLDSHPDDPDCLYNLACCLARRGDFEGSLHYLKEAVDKGFRDLDTITADEDLNYIRQSNEFNQLAGRTGLM